MILPVNTEDRYVENFGSRGYEPKDSAYRRELLLPEVLRMLRLRWRLIAGCTAACLLLSVGYVLIKAPRYQSASRIEVSPAGTNSLGMDGLASRVLNPSDAITQLQSAVTVLRSSTVALAAMQQARLAERKEFAGSWVQPPGTDVLTLSPRVRDQLLHRFSKSLSVDVVPKTDIITVQFRAKDPTLAAEVVNATVSSYAERNFRSSYDSAAQVSNWLSAQMEDLKLKANQAQEKLAALQKRRGLIGDETDNIVTDELKNLNEQLTSAEADRIVKEARYRIVGSGNPELIASAIPEPTLQMLRSQQAQLRVDYAKLSAKFGDGYPKLAELGSQMSEVDGAIQKELKNLSDRYKNEYLAAAAAEKMLHTRFEQQKQKAYDLSEGAAQYAILKHEVEASQDLYQTLQLKLKQAGIVAGLASANIGVVESGQVPSEPFDPKPLRDIPVGTGSGLLLGIAAAVTLEALDNTIRNQDEAHALSGLRVLAQIPQLENSLQEGWREWFRKPEVSLQLVEPRSPAAESYRCLRTALMVSPSDRARVLAVTGFAPAEGKSLTSINYAAALAQQGARVLLVDADLRQPSIQPALNVPDQRGLSDLLAEGATVVQSAPYLQARTNLYVLPAGKPCTFPAELLAGETMAGLLADWRTQFDYVVIDTPPLSMFTDAVVIASQADAVLLVARCGLTTTFGLRQGLGLLRQAQVNLAGIVLNAVDLRYQRSYYQPYGLAGMRARHLEN